MSFSISKQTIGQASILIAVFTVISQGLGLIRESLIANFLGTSAEYDIILVALAIPSMIGTILMSSLPAAGIPSLQNDGKTETRISNIFHSPFFKTNLILGLGLMAAVIVIMPFLGKLLGVGLDDRSVGYVLKYGYVFCILIPLRSLEAAFQCLLHVRYHFIFPAVSTIGFNIVIIGILAILFPTLGPPVYVAAVIGGTFIEMLLIGAPAYFMYKKQGTPIAFSDFSNSNYLKLLGMVALIESIGQLVDPFDRFLSGICLLPGYVSANYYANLVGQLPIRIVVVSLSAAIFPSMAELAAAEDKVNLSRLYHRAIAICIMLIVPIAAYSICFRNEIISFLFERGRFDEQSKAWTAGIFYYYSVAMIFSAIYYVQSRVLFSLKDWKNLLWARIIGLFVKMVFGMIFIKTHWAMAIGGGTLLMSAISVFMIEYYMFDKLGIRYSKESIKPLWKSGLAGIMMVPMIMIIDYGLRRLVGLHSLSLLIVAGVIAAIAFIGLENRLKITGMSIINFRWRD